MILFMGLQALYTLGYTPTLYTLSDMPSNFHRHLYVTLHFFTLSSIFLDLHFEIKIGIENAEWLVKV